MKFLKSPKENKIMDCKYIHKLPHILPLFSYLKFWNRTLFSLGHVNMAPAVLAHRQHHPRFRKFAFLTKQPRKVQATPGTIIKFATRAIINAPPDGMSDLVTWATWFTGLSHNLNTHRLACPHQSTLLVGNTIKNIFSSQQAEENFLEQQRTNIPRSLRGCIV